MKLADKHAGEMNSIVAIVPCPCCGNAYFSRIGEPPHPYITKIKCFNCGVKVPIIRLPAIEAVHWWMEQLMNS